MNSAATKSDHEPRGWRRNDHSQFEPMKRLIATQFGHIHGGNKMKLTQGESTPQAELKCNHRRLPKGAAAGGRHFSGTEVEEEGVLRQFNMSSVVSQVGPDSGRKEDAAQGCSFRRLQSDTCIFRDFLLQRPTIVAVAVSIVKSRQATTLGHYRCGRQAHFNCHFLLAIALALVCLVFLHEAEAQSPSSIQPQHHFVMRSDDQDHKRLSINLRPDPQVSRVYPAQQQKQLLRKSSSAGLDFVSSADLPAEFRGLDDGDLILDNNNGAGSDPAPKEQSKLAKLCQQTSSVLASVLPAPFGGHKRSILCQFFGQVPQEIVQRPTVSQSPAYKQQLEPASIAVIQRPQLPSITMLTSGRHPIQMVVEQFQQQQKQQQMMMAQSLQVGRPQLPVQPSLTSAGAQDLKSSDSVIDYAYHQKLELPASMLQQQKSETSAFKAEKVNKFIAPVSMNFKPLASQSPGSPLVSTSGWRIFNHSLDSTPPPQPHPTEAATKNQSVTIAGSAFNSISPKKETITIESANSAQKVNTSMKALPLVIHKQTDSDSKEAPEPSIARNKSNSVPVPTNKRSEPTQSYDNSVQLLVMGKPPGFNNQQSPIVENKATTTTTTRQMSTLGKRSEALKSTTKPVDRMLEDGSSGMRTIEVIAQQSNGNNSIADPRKRIHQSTTSVPSSLLSPGGKPVAAVNDSNQVSQKREELVIASINNLTRIAFGNQLRDTVKVINKLIDQQAELFGSNKASDPLSSAESRVAANGDVSTNKVRTPANKSLALSGGKENSISLTTSKSRQKHIQTGTSPQVNQIKSTKKPKKQLRVQESSSTRVTSPTTTTSVKKSTSFIFQKLSTPSAAITEPRTARSSSERRSVVLANESRRLSHASSRSLALDLAHRRTTKPVSFDDSHAASMTDVRREKTSWQARSTPQMSSQIKTTSTAKPTITSSALKWRSPVATTNSWLLPDRTLYQSDLFGGSRTVKRPNSMESYKRWTTRTEPTKTAPLSAKQALVLNRIDNTIEPTKIDSLTTLKMSLTTQVPPSTSSSLSPPTGIQSRWIPTLTVTPTTSTTSAPPTFAAVPISTTTTTAAAASAITTTIPQPAITTMEHTQKTKDTVDSSTTPIRESLSTLSEMNEARASDSISRYTTHWNEANELLATTRRFSQQPLPQTAHTGEFFDSETISIWPERYQTMIGQAQDGAKTTVSSFETTRRNGESYETNNPLARHRYDVNTLPADAPRRTTAMDAAFLANMSSVTILPSNHKLTTSNDNQNTEITLNMDHEPKTTAIKQEPTSRPSLIPRYTAPTPGVAYTLIGPFSEPATLPPAEELLLANGGGGGVTRGQEVEKFPNVLDDLLLPSGSKARLNSNSSSQLRPPYLGPLDGEQQSTDPTLVYDHEQALSRPHISKKLYELLVPSTRNFVGSQNPLNQQRFNLSALKFLAQNILASPVSHNYNDSINWPDYYQQQSDNNSSSQQQRLLDMLGTSFPSNYYETLLNESGSPSDANRNSTGRSIIGRAGNLLNDLKQLEHKKAAAILAAIRYQVPSPLVRPWDLTSDSMSSLSQMRDRLDESGNDYIRDSLLFAQASQAAIKAAIARQRVIPRDELEAHLNGSRQFNPGNDDDDEASISERRTDSQISPGLSYSMSDNDDEFVVASNGSRHDDADYTLSNTRPLLSGGVSKYNRGRNFTKTILDKLLGAGGFGSLRSNLNRTIGQNATIDLDPTDDLSKAKTQSLQDNDGSSSSGPPSTDQYPKYIRFMDYRTWGGRSSGGGDGGESLANSQLHLRQHMPSSVIAAKLRENMARFKATTSATEPSDREIDGEIKKMDRKKDYGNSGFDGEKSISFDCTGKQSGFHPDVETACQTFYHCSSTGHLLTFNCPQQTRFDEKSLKCGPWFEVPCDLGRSKQKRLVA